MTRLDQLITDQAELEPHNQTLELHSYPLIFTPDEPESN
jgi:hypothetical protein